MFEILSRDPQSRARAGRLTLAHGVVETPVFMPVGTAATVKALPHADLEAMGAQILLANTYPLYLRPGAERIGRLGGLHRFMSWPHPILTDSGGFQIFSQRELISVEEDGAWFTSHLDGSRHFLSPERALEVQQQLGSDIAMVLDECTHYPCTRPEASASMELTERWARRCREAHSEQGLKGQRLFAIVQGSVYEELRARSAGGLCRMDFDGYAVGGLSVGEPKGLMYAVTEQCGEILPEEKPRYLMGVGTPPDLLECVTRGMDMFDCVLPTRNARNGYLFTSAGRLSIKNARFADDDRPVDEQCGCGACRRFSRAYLRHLFMAGEILSSVLNTLHNVYFYLDLMSKIRQSIASQNFGAFKAAFLARYEGAERAV